MSAGDSAQLVERGDLDDLTRHVDRLCHEQRWDDLVDLRRRCQAALTRGSAPAELFRVVGTGYSVGIIAAVSKPFCGACDRVRLTADGQIRNCLFARTESDLRTPLRRGASDAELAALSPVVLPLFV